MSRKQTTPIDSAGEKTDTFSRRFTFRDVTRAALAIGISSENINELLEELFNSLSQSSHSYEPPVAEADERARSTGKESVGSDNSKGRATEVSVVDAQSTGGYDNATSLSQLPDHKEYSKNPCGVLAGELSECVVTEETKESTPALSSDVKHAARKGLTKEQEDFLKECNESLNNAGGKPLKRELVPCPTCSKTVCKHFQYRADGRLEWVCEHGVGHTMWYPDGSDGLHGCDGCCSKKHAGREATPCKGAIIKPQVKMKISKERVEKILSNLYKAGVLKYSRKGYVPDKNYGIYWKQHLMTETDGRATVRTANLRAHVFALTKYNWMLTPRTTNEILEAYYVMDAFRSEKKRGDS